MRPVSTRTGTARPPSCSIASCRRSAALSAGAPPHDDVTALVLRYVTK